jgi:hypothetical protein
LALQILHLAGVTILERSQGVPPVMGDCGRNVGDGIRAARFSTAVVDEWTFFPESNSIPPNAYRKRSQMNLKFNSTVQFIFAMGLEGTGHHLSGEITRLSPAMNRLIDANIWLQHVPQLHKALYWHYDPRDASLDVGIWNAHCPTHRKDAAMLESRIVERLRIIEARGQNWTQSNHSNADYRHFPLPVNTVTVMPQSRYGEVSYPNWDGPCRPLAYPDINLLYRACEIAQVDCFHFYIHRPPLDLLRSVVNRGFSGNDTSTMQLYITNLHVLTNQLRMYSSKTLGCFGFLGMDRGWMTAQQDLWDFEHDRYQEIIGSFYRPPVAKNRTHVQQVQQWMKETEHGPYLQSWWKAHQHAIETCRRPIVDGAGFKPHRQKE